MRFLGGLFQRTLFQGVTADFDRFLSIIAGLYFYHELAVDVADFLVPHAELMFAHGKAFDCELAILVSHGSIGVVDGEPVGGHPGMEIAGDLEGQRFCGFDFHLLSLAHSRIRRDQDVGS